MAFLFSALLAFSLPLGLLILKEAKKNDETRASKGETKKVIENKSVREVRLQQQREEKNKGEKSRRNTDLGRGCTKGKINEY